VEQFLQNCELSSLEVRVEQPGAPPGSRRFVRPFLLIGSDPRNDIRLEGDEVSRRHAYLQGVGGRVYCVDLGSRTGVHWAGGPRASGWVAWDEPLRIGPNVIQIARPQQTALVLKGEAGALPAPVAAVFEVDHGTTPVRWRMHELVTLVGGAAACKVRLRHTDVSQFHCGLVRGPLGVWVVDLLSREATRVNGQPVPWTRLAEGDRVQVGPFELRLLENGPPPAERAILPPPRAAVPVPEQSLLLPVVNEFNRMQQQMLDQFHQTMLMMAEMFTTLHREQSALVREELEHVRQLTRQLHTLQAERARQTAEPPADLATAQADSSARLLTAADAPASGKAANGAGAIPPSPEPSRKAGKTVSPNVHNWLSERIEQLQEERYSRWQRILQFITGEKEQ
jgi:pSer/pThr/pTyr-binding forkhead associated (FHA) protein